MNTADLLQILKLDVLTAGEALKVLTTLEDDIVVRARRDKTLVKRNAAIPYWARWRTRNGPGDPPACVIYRRSSPPKPGVTLVVEEGFGPTWARALLAVLVSHPSLVTYTLGEAALAQVQALIPKDTGRAPSEPNLQNIPVRTETGDAVRQAFVEPQAFVDPEVKS